MIKVNDIKSLNNKDIYHTSNEKYVLTKDINKVIYSKEFKILGFLNNYMYTYDGIYITKRTIDNGNDIADIKVDIKHCSFIEGNEYFFAFSDRKIYKISENFDIDWVLEFDINIKKVIADLKGCIYVIYENINHIRKFLPDGNEIMYITASDDITKTVKLFDCFVTKGGGWLYVLGSEYWGYNNKAQSFIDKYNVRTGELVNRQIFASDINISENNPKYLYNEFYLSGDYFYIYGQESIIKINIKGIECWKYITGYNSITSKFDNIYSTEYSDNPFTEYLYFSEDLYSTNGHSFGKMTLNGNILWKMVLEKSNENADFHYCIYNNGIYTSAKTMISFKKSYILSINDDKILFKTRNGNLIEILEYNEDELYSPNNYYGIRLLADSIKDNIPTLAYSPLLHDYGDIVDENNNVLLLESEYDPTKDSNNYEYKYLICSSYCDKLPGLDIIFTKNSKSLYTKLKNKLKVKESYEPEKIHEYIIDNNNHKINTMENQDLIRSRFEYSYDRYLLADRNMSLSSIITKALQNIIITKKDGHKIVRKTHESYKYLLSKYNDISLIEEWLKENGVVDSGLPKYVDELIHHTVGMINDIQIAGIPIIYNIQPYKQFSYTFDGNEYPIRTWGAQIFSCNNLPFNKRKCQNKIYIDSLSNLIEEEILRPFIIFLNGKAIPWTDCTIVKDWSYTYLVLTNTNPLETNINCIMFPCIIRYGEDNNIIQNNICETNFYFNRNGEITNNIDDISIRIEVIDPNIIGSSNIYDNTNNDYIEVINNYNQLASDQNIFIINDNIIDFDSKYYISGYGKDIFTYSRNDINIKSTIVKTFYWIKANEYYGTLYKIPNGADVMDYCIYDAIQLNHNSSIDNFKPPFQFTLYKHKTYDTNIAQAVEYIMGYDMNLLIDFYKENSDMKSYIFTGQQLIDRVPKDGGWLILPRTRKNNYDDYIIVFKNCQLYEYYSDIEYSSNIFKIPIFNHVKRTDIIEIMHFKKVNNLFNTLTISENESDYLSEDLRFDNFLLFGNTFSGDKFYRDFNIESGVQYPIEFSYKNNFNQNNKYINTDIKLNDIYYLNKKINICSKRQFQYMYYNIYENTNSINLAPQFRFCHLKNHYMIFKNNRRLTNNDWELNLPSEIYKSKYMNITFNLYLYEGDKIDIFYLPTSYEEIYSANNEFLSTDISKIQLNIEDLGYPFDKDLFMIFINGNKLNYEFIDNLNIHTINVNLDKIRKVGDNVYTNNINNICILKFLQEDELLNKLFSYSDQWTNSTDSLSNEEYLKLLTQKIKK